MTHALTVTMNQHGSDARLTFEVVEVSDACFVHHLLQYVPQAVVKRISIWPI